MHVHFQSYPRQPIPVRTQLQLHIPPFQVHYLLHFYGLFHPAKWLSVIEFMKSMHKTWINTNSQFWSNTKSSLLACKQDQYGVCTSASKWTGKKNVGIKFGLNGQIIWVLLSMVLQHQNSECLSFKNMMNIKIFERYNMDNYSRSSKLGFTTIFSVQ